MRRSEEEEKEIDDKRVEGRDGVMTKEGRKGEVEKGNDELNMRSVRERKEDGRRNERGRSKRKVTVKGGEGREENRRQEQEGFESWAAAGMGEHENKP